MMTNEDKAQLIWKRVYKNLYGRSGFDHWYDSIEFGILEEMEEELVQLITKTLNELDGLNDK